MKEINVGDKFILHCENGKDYNCIVHNINNFRPPEMRYCLDADVNGVPLSDYAFVDELFFERNEDIIEFIDNGT